MRSARVNYTVSRAGQKEIWRGRREVVLLELTWQAVLKVGLQSNRERPSQATKSGQLIATTARFERESEGRCAGVVDIAFGEDLLHGGCQQSLQLPPDRSRRMLGVKQNGATFLFRLICERGICFRPPALKLDGTPALPGCEH